MAETVVERLTGAWARTDKIFEILAPGAFLAQPIALRHPFIFYVGHLPAFAWNHICGGILGFPSLNAGFDELFSRGIDPDVDDPTRCHDHPDVPDRWPAVGEVLAYRDGAPLPFSVLQRRIGRKTIGKKLLERNKI